MCLLANSFWDLKTIVDVIAVVSLFLTLFSILLAVYLARQDLKKRIDAAQREAIDRLSSILLQAEVAEAVRTIREARRLCREKQWSWALDRCEQAIHRLPRFRPLPGLTDDDGLSLDKHVDNLRLLMTRIEEIIAGKKPDLTDTNTRKLDGLDMFLSSVEGKLFATALR